MAAVCHVRRGEMQELAADVDHRSWRNLRIALLMRSLVTFVSVDKLQKFVRLQIRSQPDFGELVH